jgi:hypothetical protein
MGLFDGYVDPQQFGSGGGLLGRLLALPQMQGVNQPDVDVDATSVPPTSSVPPLLPGFGALQTNGTSSSPLTSYQPLQPPSGVQPQTIAEAFSSIGPASASHPLAGPPNPALGAGAYGSVNPGSSPASPNTLLAQYSPAMAPVGIPLPPVFIPGTPENNAFVHSTITAGRAIGNAFGNILNSDKNENPIPGTTPGNETNGRSRIFVKPGGYDDAIKDFNGLNPTNVRPIPKGGLTGTLPDGRSVNVRPGSSDGRPTIEIQHGKKKTRYGDKQ